MTIIDTFKSRIQAAERIIITTHEYPDADGIGSQISLCLALRELGKDVYCVNEEPLLERYSYLDVDKVVIGYKTFQTRHPEFNPQLIIVVDTNTKLRVGKELCLYITDSVPTLYIDHHPCRGRDLSNHCIDITAAATGQMIGEMIESIGVKFTKKIALPIYTAIIIDTSSFRYPTVSASTHRLVAKLMDTGINPPEAYNGIYGTKRVPHMHLLARILNTASTNAAETVAWMLLKQEDINNFASDVEDTHAFINNLLILNNIKVACMFRDDGDQIKMSLRSSGEMDVGTIALSLGGGGHSHSAATILNRGPGESTEAVIIRAIEKVEETLKKLEKEMIV
ncbi:MAG TPA: bifunctional oligoribonuclease/PAP phosphatase NrnA [Bacteriovoracaceae bacterium]|nr:bifunctional oligoribonuclease/PAP phosphatase NrnA [Bacteriovoracaceae bacterium]